MPLIDQIRVETLIKLAKIHFASDLTKDKLTQAELKVLHDSASSEDVSLPAKDIPRPEVRAAFLRWLLTDPEAAPFIDPKGLRVYGFTILDKLDLETCNIPIRLDFRCCTAKGEINLQQAGTRDIFILDSLLEGERGFRADAVDIHGELLLKGSSFASEIRLLGAEISGDLELNAAKLKARGDALTADNAHIGGNVFLTDGFESLGEISLLNVEITGNLECCGAKMIRFLCQNTVVKGNLIWQRIEEIP